MSEMSVGAQLRHARAERKWSLADVAGHTKIQPWVLEALEADRLQTLMSPIYVKGFLTSYAKFLHLAPEPLIAQLSWPQPAVEQTTVPPPTRSLPVFRFPPLLLRRLAGAAALAGILAALALLPPAHRRPVASAPHRQPSAQKKAAPMTQKAAAPKATATQPALASVAPLTRSEPEAPALPTLTLLASEPLELLVTAQTTTWIQVKADGKLLTQQRMNRGAHERWVAAKRLELVIAKPTQVDLILNGHSITPFAITHKGRLLITHRGVTRLPDE